MNESDKITTTPNVRTVPESKYRDALNKRLPPDALWAVRYFIGSMGSEIRWTFPTRRAELDLLVAKDIARQANVLNGETTVRITDIWELVDGGWIEVTFHQASQYQVDPGGPK